MSRPVPAVLVVDDIEANLSGLAGRLRERLPGHEIGTWQPRRMRDRRLRCSTVTWGRLRNSW